MDKGVSYKGVPAVTPSSHGLEDVQRSTLPVLLVAVAEEEHVILKASWLRSASYFFVALSSSPSSPTFCCFYIHFTVVILT